MIKMTAMKAYKILATGLFALMAFPALAQQTAMDSTVTAIKAKELAIRKTSLQKQIAVEDGKRNQRIDGLTPEAQEAMNDRQDSICLELRSQLVAIELELKELVPDKTITKIIERVNRLNQQQGESGQSPTDEATQPAATNGAKKKIDRNKNV